MPLLLLFLLQPLLNATNVTVHLGGMLDIRVERTTLVTEDVPDNFRVPAVHDGVLHVALKKITEVVNNSFDCRVDLLQGVLG